MIIKTNTTNTTSPTKLTLNKDLSIYYGEVICDLTDARLYTINLNNLLIKADYPRKVIEFKDFKPTNYKDGYLLSIDTSQNYNSFTLTSLPFMSIDMLGGTDIPSQQEVSRDGKYLAFNSNKDIVLENRPQFSVFDLGDVASLTNEQRQQKDQEALTYVDDSTGVIVSTKDYYTRSYPGYWTLKPELKSLKLADDVLYTNNSTHPISNYRVLRQTTRFEFRQTGKPVVTDTLKISADPAPVLGNNLNCNIFCTFKEQFSYDLVLIEQEQATEENPSPDIITSADVEIDFSKQIITIQNLPDTLETLTVTITNLPTTVNKTKLAILDISNFEGLLLFLAEPRSARLVYENGLLEMSGGKRNIFNILARADQIVITHKAINLLPPTRYSYE